MKLSCGIDYDGILFIISGLSFSLIPCGRHPNVYIVASHSRDITGRPSFDGKAIILKFQNFQETTNYIVDVYGSTDNIIQYEIQFIKISHLRFSANDKRLVVLNHKSELQRNGRTRRTPTSVRNTSAKCNSLPPTKQVKECKITHSKIMKTKQECIEAFHKKINEGPYFICVTCNRSLYRRSVNPLTISSFDNFIPRFKFSWLHIKSFFCQIS